MAEYIYPLATLVLDFFCVLLCIRYAVTKRRMVWLVPTLLSIILLTGSIVCLLAAASKNAGQTVSEIASYLSIFIFAVSAVWILVIVAFGRTMKPRLNQAAIDEAQFLAKRSGLLAKPKIDSRPTVTHKVEKTTVHVVRPGSDPYDAGPVRTVRPRRTAI